MRRSWLLVPLSVLAVASASCPAPTRIRDVVRNEIAERLVAFAALRPLADAAGFAAAPEAAADNEPMLVGADLARFDGSPTAAVDAAATVPAAYAPEGAGVAPTEPEAGDASEDSAEWGFGASGDASTDDPGDDDGAGNRVDNDDDGEASEVDEPVDDGEHEVDPEAAPSPEKANDPAGPFLASIARETWIYAEPRFKSRRIGYLRAGAVIRRAAKPAGITTHCKAGWFRIEPRGFVCAQRTATLDVHDPIVEASAVRPRTEGLPYDYAMGRIPTPPLYARVPSSEDQKQYEPDLASHLRKVAHLAGDKDYVPLPEPGDVPPALLYGQSLPGLADGPPRSKDATFVGHARIRSGFALLGQFDSDGRRFAMTSDLTVVPLDRTRWVKPSTFRGLKLEGGVDLPVAFVMKRHATRYVAGDDGRRKAGDVMGYRDAVPITGKNDAGFLETKDGGWVRAEDVVRVDRFSNRPTWATAGRKWIDVSILEQSLVAYEGERPVFATLVSTGRDGIGDPKKTHSTIQGTFLIHTKHVTVTMDGDEAGDEFDLRDVPWVQYFTEGYALHAAYWHDDFGKVRSHGCVNLAPLDASWLFAWTDPEVPEGWHAALSLKKGTLVYTHP